MLAGRAAAPRAGMEALVVARHLVRAGRWTDDTQLLAVGPLAADTAYQLGDHATAADVAEATLAAARRSDAGEALLARLHLRAGAALHRAHEQHQYRRHLDAAIAYAEAGDDPEVWVEALDHLLRADQTIGGRRVSPSELQPLLDRLGGEHAALRSRMLQLRSEVCFTNGQFDVGVTDGLEAASVARRVGDGMLEAKAAIATGLNRWARLDLAGAGRSLETGQRLASLADDPWITTWGRGRLAMVHVMTGRLDAAELEAKLNEDRSAELGQWSDRALASAVLATVDLHRGDLAGAERHSARALAHVARSEYHWAAQIVIPVMACARALRGDRAGAHEALGLWKAAGRPAPAVFRMAADLTAGEPNRAANRLGVPRTDRRPTALNLASLVLSLLACSELDRHDQAKGLLGLLEDLDERNVVLPLEWLASVPRARARAYRPSASSTRLLPRARPSGGGHDVGWCDGRVGARATWSSPVSTPTDPGVRAGRRVMHAEDRAELADTLDLRIAADAARALALSLGSFHAARRVDGGARGVVLPPVCGAFLVTDIVESTTKAHRARDEAWVPHARRARERSEACLRRFDGVTFRAPGRRDRRLFREPADAVRCALALHDSLAAIEIAGTHVSVHVGICAGEARPRRAGDLTGEAIVRAHRIMAAAGAGQTLIGEELVAPAVLADLRVTAAGTIEPRGYEGDPFPSTRSAPSASAEVLPVSSARMRNSVS